MKPKLVFFDIDGTLLPYGKDVPQDTREALQQMKERGHLPIICTGRTRPTMNLVRPVVELNFPGTILGAGCEIVYQGETIYRRVIEDPVLDWTVDLLDRAGCGQILEGPEGLYCPERWEGTILETWVSFVGSRKIFHRYQPHTQSIQKMIFFNSGGLRGTEIERELSKYYSVLYYDFGGVGEMIPKDVNKATGIQRLLEHLGADLEDTYAFGDGPNDLEMLQYVRHGIAMGNAPASVKAVTPYETAGCEEGGIALALGRFGLI